MSDIFISYASEDRDRVQFLAQALERKGWSVWWDRRILIGRSFDEVIEEALDASRAVVVVWTQTSVKSQWVKNEAREGLRRRVLFPVMLQEEVRIPLEFRDVQAAQLIDWNSEGEHDGFAKFLDDLTQGIGGPVTPVVQPPSMTKNPTATPVPELEPLSKSASDVESQPELLETKPFGSMAGVRRQDLLVKPGSPKNATDSLQVDPDSARTSDDCHRELPGVGQSTKSFPYLSIGMGIFVVIGTAVYFSVITPSPSPVTKDESRHQSAVQAPSAKTEMITPMPRAESLDKSTLGTAPSQAVMDEGAKGATGAKVKEELKRVYERRQAEIAARMEATKGELEAIDRKIENLRANNKVQLKVINGDNQPLQARLDKKRSRISGKDGVPMMLVLAGRFWMGSPSSVPEKDEHPLHQVTLDKFYMDKFEVTNRSFERFVLARNYRTTAEREGKSWAYVNGIWGEIAGANWKMPEGRSSVFDSNRADHPVVSVSWEDADAYCRWAGK
jgi:Sulfatase-modifying factor enzyme 1/TIR domain